MKKTTINLLRLVLLLIASQLGGCTGPATKLGCDTEDPFTSAIPTCYSSADVAGRIVDEKTGEPIPNAVVVGIWQLEMQGFEHAYGAAIHVVESVTDETGRYHLEGFEPRSVVHLTGRLMEHDPRLYILAEGYKPIGRGRYHNYYTDRSNMGAHRISPLNGKDISLERMGLSNEFEANSWSGTIRMMVDAGKCAITKLKATKILLEHIEPEYNKLIKEFYGWNEKHYTNALKRCKREGTQ